MKADAVTGTMVKDSANDAEGVAVEGKEKTHGREKGTEEDGVAVHDTKENTSEQENVKYFVATEKKLWELLRLLNNRKGSLSSTYEKNTEANTKVYDLNQKTMQALNALAEEYEIFETMKKVKHKTEEGDMLFAVAYEAMEELDKAQKDQDRLQDELEATCDSMVTVSKEFTNCWATLNGALREVDNCRALHEETCVDLKKACQSTAEIKRKANDAHERTRSHRERCRRVTKEHTKSEAAINHSLVCLGWFVKESANL